MPVLDVIREGLAHEPSNEAATCDWVIIPALRDVGYGTFDILPRATDLNSQYPDYTVLPGTEFTWYLEAKSVGVALQDTHVTQALNYAHQNGKRWAVLTNGREWRLYDDRVDGISSDRLVLAASIKVDSDLETLLHALGRDSVTSGGIERYAANSRLASELSAQLRDEGSDVVRAIWNVLKKRPGLGQLSRKSIVEHFGEATVPASISAPPALVSPKPVIPTLSVDAPQSGSEYTLEFLAKNADATIFRTSQVDGSRRSSRRPCGVQCPGLFRAHVRKWWELATVIATWVVENRSSTPVPFAPWNGCEYFINACAEHEKGPMRNPRELELGDRRLFVETHHSAGMLLEAIERLCRAAGVDPATITVTLAE